MVLIAKTVIFFEIGLEHFAWLGKYFPQRFEEAKEKLHKEMLKKLEKLLVKSAV